MSAEILEFPQDKIVRRLAHGRGQVEYKLPYSLNELLELMNDDSTTFVGMSLNEVLDALVKDGRI